MIIVYFYIICVQYIIFQISIGTEKKEFWFETGVGVAHTLPPPCGSAIVPTLFVLEQ